MNKMFDLSIVIVNYNVKDLLRDCLNTIYMQTNGISFEIFVVDNASSDGSVDIVKREFPWVKLIRNEENLGFPKANNIAIKRSCGKYILLLNPDTVVLDNALQKMVIFMDEHPEAGAVGPKILNLDGTIQRSARNYFPTLKNQLYFHYIFLKIIMKLKTIFIENVKNPYIENSFLDNITKQTCWIIGSCIMMRNKVMDKIVFLEERIFLFAEDTDLCYRIIQSGWKIYFLEKAEIIHYGGASSDQLDTVPFHRVRSTCQFFKIHYGELYTTCFRLILPINILSNLGVALLRYLNTGRKKRVKMKQNIKAQWRIFKWSVCSIINSFYYFVKSIVRGRGKDASSF